LDKIEARQKQEKRRSRRLFMQRVSAAAACLAIGVLTWMMISNYSRPQTCSQSSSSRRVEVVPGPSVSIELVSKNGIILIPANQRIASNNELKTLVINHKHRLMMNTDTVLALEPLEKNSHSGCVVKLASGQIYTHVLHDGNPFIVDTTYGQAMITEEKKAKRKTEKPVAQKPQIPAAPVMAESSGGFIGKNSIGRQRCLFFVALEQKGC
jgi:ferric-dicitrate binding protein FerR (iron transport regulator)